MRKLYSRAALGAAAVAGAVSPVWAQSSNDAATTAATTALNSVATDIAVIGTLGVTIVGGIVMYPVAMGWIKSVARRLGGR